MIWAMNFLAIRFLRAKRWIAFCASRTAEGVLKRYGSKHNRKLLEKAEKQVEHELALIEKLGFAGYFLIVWDLVEYCKRNDILIQGRGSAAIPPSATRSK